MQVKKSTRYLISREHSISSNDVLEIFFGQPIKLCSVKDKMELKVSIDICMIYARVRDSAGRSDEASSETRIQSPVSVHSALCGLKVLRAHHSGIRLEYVCRWAFFCQYAMSRQARIDDEPHGNHPRMSTSWLSLLLDYVGACLSSTSRRVLYSSTRTLKF